VSGWTTVSQDLHSGPDSSHQYPNWDIQESRFTNHEGAVGYVIGQGSNCLTWEKDYGQVGFQPCDLNAYNQIWYVDGDELMASDNECMNEDWNGSKRWLSGCDGLNGVADPNRNDDQFVLTPPGGSVIPDTVANWKSHVSTYEHA
jgi:hypothetical protein